MECYILINSSKKYNLKYKHSFKEAQKANSFKSTFKTLTHSLKSEILQNVIY